MRRAPTMLAALLVALALVVACGDDNEVDDPPPPDQPAEPAPPADPVPPEPDDENEAERGTESVELASCSNDGAGYSVEYPADWHTNSGEVTAPCSFFDPNPISVPEATDSFDFAIEVRLEPVRIEEVVGDDPFARTLDQDDVGIDGHDAVRRETEITSDGFLPAGTRVYEYLVDLGEETLFVATHGVEGNNYQRNRTVLDAMVDSLAIDR